MSRLVGRGDTSVRKEKKYMSNQFIQHFNTHSHHVPVEKHYPNNNSLLTYIETP